MRWCTVVISFLLLAFGVACASGSNSGNPASPSQAALGEAFTLKPSGMAVVQGEDLQIGFDRVLSDSRCPRGTRCITEGEAIIRVWLFKRPRGRTENDLRTTPPSAAGALYEGYLITLVALEPYPEADRPIRSSDYVVTLLVTRPQ